MQLNSFQGDFPLNEHKLVAIHNNRNFLFVKIISLFRSIFLALIFFIIQFSASTCLGEKLPVITSIYPIADMIQQVGGDHVDVTCILQAGDSPHTFEPKPSLVKKFSSARIFFMVGAGFEFWAQKFINLSGKLFKTVVLSQGISLIHTTGHHHDKKDVSDHESEVANPHIWLDPEIAKSMVNKIITALCEVDHKNTKYYKQQGQMYLNELDKLHRQIKATVETFSIRKYVSFHASWDYFARSYGLESVGVIEAAPGRDPTPLQIRDIIALIKKHHIRAVFAEPQLNPRAAKVIAREANVNVLLLDPLGGPKIKGRSTYLDLMKFNLSVLQEAMK
jgi:ABC-type Zn uptake system ZnuABC Zn-binding protein ZnuA